MCVFEDSFLYSQSFVLVSRPESVESWKEMGTFHVLLTSFSISFSGVYISCLKNIKPDPWTLFTLTTGKPVCSVQSCMMDLRERWVGIIPLGISSSRVLNRSSWWAFAYWLWKQNQFHRSMFETCSPWYYFLNYWKLLFFEICSYSCSHVGFS